MFVVLLQNNIRISITENEAAQIAVALTKGAKVYHLERTREFIPLRPAPGILRAETLDNADLQKKREYRCGAKNTHPWGESCTCFQRLPTISELYPEVFKTIPQLTYQEELESRAESGERRAAGIIRKERENAF